MTACIVCFHDLEPTERQSCQKCLAEVRRALVRLEQLFAMLPGLMSNLGAAAALDSVLARGGDEATLPGGDLLVLLGPGSASHDGRASDPPAVAFELRQWAGDWCELRRENPALVPTKVPALVDWLSTRAGWAADHHPAFEEFALDLRRIVVRMEDVTGTSERPEQGPPCPYCRASLLREFRSGRRCHHRRQSWGLGLVALPPGVHGPARLETLADRDARIAAAEAEHALCDSGGLPDDWVCNRCRRAFNPPQYRLAVIAALEAGQQGA